MITLRNREFNPGMSAILDRPNHALPSRPTQAAAERSRWIAANAAVSNDNVATPRATVRETFATEDFVCTRRPLKLQSQSMSEGSVGQIIRVRPGRLYDVRFPFAEAMVMTLSHCDVARYRGSTH